MLKELIGDFSKLEPKPILVAGDLMLDTYTIGTAERISPEAPVAVIRVKREDALPGGAGNTLLNLSALGANPTLLGRVGQDAAGDTLLQTLRNARVSTDPILRSKTHKTPVKNRIVAENQQVVRVDHEEYSILTTDEENEVISKLPGLLSSTTIVAISDYAKGFLTPRLLKALIEEANKQKLFIIADPKGTDFTKYNGVTLLKPNLSEAYAAAKASRQTPLDQVAEILLETYHIEYLMITRASEGISLYSKKGGREDFPVKAKQVKDVTGAGDTVLAMLAFCLANKLNLSTAIHFSNVAAGIAIERFGCAQITTKDLAMRLFELDARNKVFDKEHLSALRKALDHTPCHYISLSQGQFPDAKTISQLIATKHKEQCAIVACIKDKEPDPDWIAALSALHPIDYILLGMTSDDLSPSS